MILFQGVKESAIEDCNQAIELKDNYVKALLRRGQCLEDLDKPHEALKDFEKVLEIDPGLAEAKTALMVIFYMRCPWCACPWVDFIKDSMPALLCRHEIIGYYCNGPLSDVVQ